jgi:hypothetical protein
MTGAIRFGRVVQRQGWDVELVRDAAAGAELETRNFPDRDQALEFARGLAPEWIEVGEVVPAAGQVPQHHRWTTLRRGPDGSYTDSALGWAGPAT